MIYLEVNCNSQDLLAGPRAAQRSPPWQVSILHWIQSSVIAAHSLDNVARLPKDTPAHQALQCQCHIDLPLGRLPDPSWRKCPGRLQNRWLDQNDQLRRDNGTPPADLWRSAVTRGHLGVTLRLCINDNNNCNHLQVSFKILDTARHQGWKKSWFF